MCSVAEECLADKLRRENCEQFNILVRMHLSFVLDLNTDEFSRNEAFADKKLKKWSLAPFRKSKSRGVMEGAPLTQEGINQVYQLIEFLRKEPNICKEGVFRRTGSLNRQHDLRNLLNQGTAICLDGGPYSVHDCASVLKGFLAELPEPLLTEAHYPAYCQIADLCGVVENPTHEDRLLQALRLLLLLLPSENRVLLKYVLELLNLTASYEGHNKMSADSLATLFTPHLLCPRKLSPENLHLHSQTLSGIVSFMIKNSTVLFHIPPKLAVDITAYFQEQDRKRCLSPQKGCNESVSDNFANTVFTFVDQERTAKENQSNPTEMAMAQLYAYIHTLPESAKKRKLVKQFNKENGNGTPLQILRSNMPKNKSLGDSIKKHIFQKGLLKSAKKSGFVPLRSSSEELLSSPRNGSSVRGRLFCTHNCDSSTDVSNDETLAKKLRKSNLSTENLITDAYGEEPKPELLRSVSEPDLSSDDPTRLCTTYLTSTPACLPLNDVPDMVFTPEDQDRKSMSPITKSTQRMCRAMQETMMTPRSRKPVLLVSGTNLNNLALDMQKYPQMDKVLEESSLNSESDTKHEANENSDSTPHSLTNNFREYLYSRSLLTATPTDLSFSSRTDDYNSTIPDLSTSKMSTSLLRCMDGNLPENSCDKADDSFEDVKELVLKPKQFDENGKPTVYETSF